MTTYRADYSDDAGAIHVRHFDGAYFKAAHFARQNSKKAGPLTYVIRTEDGEDTGQQVFDNGRCITVGWETY